MALFDFLFQGSPPPSVTSATTTQTGFPDWYQDLMRANIGKAASVANEPFRAYSGPRNAGFTADQNTAFQLTRDNVTAGDAAINSSQGALGQVAEGYKAGDLDPYMNPYITGVSDRIAELGNRNLMEKILPGVNDTFTNAGQFGSSRHGDFTGRAIRDTAGEIAGEQAKVLSGATTDAYKSFFQNQQDKLGAGQQLGALGQVQQNMGLKDAAAIENIGQTQQGFNQQNLTTAYNDFLEQRGYPRQNVEFLNSIIRGLPTPYSNSSSSVGPGTNNPSPISQALTVAGGLSQVLGGTNNNNTGR